MFEGMPRINFNTDIYSWNQLAKNVLNPFAPRASFRLIPEEVTTLDEESFYTSNVLKCKRKMTNVELLLPKSKDQMNASRL